MSCDPERVTGYVDGALDDAARAAVEAHLTACPACREQAEFERALRERLRGLAAIEPGPALEARVRRRLRPSAPRSVRLLLPIAAGFAVLFLWGRGAAPFVAWELARDHDHCFAFRVLQARMWSDDPSRVADWFGRQGTLLPAVPAAAGGLELVGARYCPLIDRRVAHVYYVGRGRHLSLYAVPGSVRFPRQHLSSPRGRTVRLLRLEGRIVGLVGERPQDVAAFERALTETYARLSADGEAKTAAPSSRSSRWPTLTSPKPLATIFLLPVGL